MPGLQATKYRTPRQKKWGFRAPWLYSRAPCRKGFRLWPSRQTFWGYRDTLVILWRRVDCYIWMEFVDNSCPAGIFFQSLLFSYLYKTINLRLRLKQKNIKRNVADQLTNLLLHCQLDQINYATATP